MITALTAIAIALLAPLLVLVTFTQVLYLESQRLRKRELPALAFFKEVLEDKIGARLELGLLSFSLIKHTVLSLAGVMFLAAALLRGASIQGAFGEACLLSLLNMLGAGYAIPQVLYRRTEAKWLLPIVPLLRLFILLVRPLTSLLEFLHSLTELGGVQGSPDDASSATEQLDALISAGADEGYIEEDERKLIHSVVAFGDKTVREVMTPRPNIVAVGADESVEALRQLVINEQYSRIPVYEDSIDRIAGFVHVRDVFEMAYEDRANRKIRELVRPIRFVPESKAVDDLLREMQQDGAHMAVVVDEYGNTAGLATMEDLVEEIFGEIRDEHEPADDVTPDPKGGYIVSGSFDVDGLEELFAFRPLQDTESTTVGGLVTEWLARVPKAGESVEREGLRIEVLEGNGLRVEKVRIMQSKSSSHA